MAEGSLLNNRLPEIKEQWDELLCLQADITLPVELPCYYAEKGWLEARSVVDLGTGNGYYLKRLQERFPAKKYLGLDVEPHFIGLANERYGGQPGELSFRVADIFDFDGQFPSVVCRLVAQHMPCLDEFASCVASYVELGGVVFNVEPNDNLRSFWPRMTETERLFRAFSQHRSDVGRDRNAGRELVGIAEKHGLETLRHQTLLIPSTLPGYKDLFVRFHQLIFDLFERKYGIAADYEALRQELSDWRANDASYAQIGIYVSVFRKGP